MKIVFISYSYLPNTGGLETVSELLVTEFSKAGHQLKVLTFTRAEQEENYLGEVEIIRDPKLFTLIKTFLWADIVFENNPSYSLSWPLFFIKKPLITVVHTWICRISGDIGLIDKIKLRLLKRANLVIAVSDVIKKSLSLKNAITIPNPTKSLFIDREVIRKDSSFVFLGRLVSDKGCELAIMAIVALMQRGFTPTLTIIGIGDELERLKELVSRENLTEQIIFKGKLSGQALSSELSQNQVIVVPSIWREPFGLVAIEGMTCGCVPIVSDGGGLPEAIGEAGLIFERNAIHDLVDKMELLLTNKQMLQRLKEKIPFQLLKHEPALVGSKYLDLMYRMIKK